MKLAVSQSEISIQTGFKSGFVIMSVEAVEFGRKPFEIEMTPAQTDQLIAMLQVAKRQA